MDGEAETDGPVRLEVGRVFADVEENASWTVVDGEDGRFEVHGGAEVVVVGQLVWVDEDVGRERIEGMEGTGSGERGEGEAGDEGGMETR